MKAILPLTAVVLACSGFTLRAQSVDTGILGTVADSSGAIIPGASVTITQPATAIARTVVTGATGAYEVRYLVPGEYVVEVRQNGFRSEKSSAITLVIGQMVRLDFKLQVGEVSEQVQVNAQGVMLETQNGVLGGLVPAQSIVNLPLNGRNFIQLGNLTPGVISSGAATSGSFRANGARSQYQQISFDGVTAVNNRADNEFMFPSVDAVEEFKVQSSNYSAEYGGHAGANVQLQLRSGSNALHGTAFEYLRNDVLDARGYFRPAPLQKPELRRNQFGGVANGPIFRDKTFFMASYEGIRERRATASTTSVLTAAQRQGDMSGLGTITDPLNGSPFPGGIIPTNRLNPAAVNIVNQYMMLPNTPGLTNNFAGVSRSSITQDQYMGRVDHTFGPKDQIFGHYIYHGGLYPSINIDPLFGTEHYLRNQNVAFQYLHTFSSAKLNEFRFGYLRATKIRLSPRRASGFTAEKDLGISGLKVGGPNGRPLQEYENGFPQISISGYVAMGDSTGGEALDSNRSYQFVDNFSLIRGKHALKTGVDVRRLTGEANTTNVPYGQINFARDISGNPVSAFMLGYPKTQQTPEGILLSGVQQWRYGFYFQDDWRVSSRLTLNLGVRYDLNLLPQDKNGTSRTLRFDLDPKGPVLWPDPGQKVDLFLKEHNHIAPRVGFAYRLRNNLTLRGGYGIFTMAAHFDQINTLQINPPNASILLTNTNTNPLATIQNPFPASLLPANPIYNVVSTEVDRRHLDGYYQNWNLTAGYELSRHDVLELGYAGSKGTHLDTSHLNFNSPPPNPAATDIQSRRPYPQFGRVRIWGSDGNSNYHSMQARLEHRFAQGLTTTVAFTWSHLIDDQQGGLNGSRALAQDPRNVRSNMRADSADDLRRSLVAGFVWDLPFASKLTGVPGGILHGWKLGGIVTLRSGSPILVTQDGDILNTDAQGEIRPNSVPGVSPILPNDQRTLDRWFNTAAFARATTTYGTAPRNPLVGPGLSTADLSFSKSFRTREHDRIEFRFEAFNALNTPQYGNPGSTLGSTNFGRITSTRVNNREMQAALKYVF